jgi:hypothetical protein
MGNRFCDQVKAAIRAMIWKFGFVRVITVRISPMVRVSLFSAFSLASRANNLFTFANAQQPKRFHAFGKRHWSIAVAVALAVTTFVLARSETLEATTPHVRSEANFRDIHCQEF